MEWKKIGAKNSKLHQLVECFKILKTNLLCWVVLLMTPNYILFVCVTVTARSIRFPNAVPKLLFFVLLLYISRDTRYISIKCNVKINFKYWKVFTCAINSNLPSLGNIFYWLLFCVTIFNSLLPKWIKMNQDLL